VIVSPVSAISTRNYFHILASHQQQQERSPIVVMKKVRFDAPVLVREYPITLGFGGAYMDGPPITLGWEILSAQTMSLKAYERCRRPLIRKSKQERTLLLSNLGFTEQEILQAERIAAAIRTDRIESSCDGVLTSDVFATTTIASETTTNCAVNNKNNKNINQIVLSSRRCGDFSVFQRSPQGTKAMLMFQKQRAVRCDSLLPS
jgi:hypothetical protein